MDWIKWLIPLIALAVWVLSNLARNREEPRRPTRSSPPAGGSGDPPSTPRRRSSAEIDEFLQEVRRRREVNEQRKVKKAPANQEPRRPVEAPRARPSLSIPEPVMPPAPPPPPPPVVPVPAISLPRIPTASTLAKEEIVVARVVSEPVKPAQRTVQPAPTVTVTARRIGPPATPKQILQMLRNPQALARAIVLREIFEPPLSRRPPRRPGMV